MHSPELLRCVTLHLECGDYELPSLCLWLRRRAVGRVERLALSLRSPHSYYGALFDEEAGHADAMDAPARMLFRALRAAGAPGQLQHLHLRADSDIDVTSLHQLKGLCASLRSLRLEACLEDEQNQSSCVSANFNSCSALESLWLSSQWYYVEDLPPRLTHLHLRGCLIGSNDGHSLPPQASAGGAGILVGRDAAARAMVADASGHAQRSMYDGSCQPCAPCRSRP